MSSHTAEPVCLNSDEELDSACVKNEIKDKKKGVVLLTGKKRPRRLTSSVWVHFDFLDEPDENGNLMCKCKKCGTTYNADSKNGTGNLLRHLKSCKMRKYRDIGQMLLEKTSSGLENRLVKFDADEFRELVGMAIVRHDLPFQFAEYEGIRKCFRYLHPDFKPVTRNTIKTDVLKMFKRESQKLKFELGDGTEHDDVLTQVVDKVRELYEAYATICTSSTTNASNVAADSKVQSMKEDLDELMDDFDEFSTKKATVANKDYLDMYFEDALLPRTTNLDVLMYWRNNSVRYPPLALMAKDILAVPVSTVASESAFSTGGRVLDSYRSSLKPSTVEAIICLRDWTFGEAHMDPQLENLCGSVMNLKVDNMKDDTPIASPAMSSDFNGSSSKK
ncbi:hypothetical protein BVRB_5g111910 [Beta vulgaris subsp. vulgaris]|nr:hypothetical protein BVRB_5g111910 [Beta vulgaris subsp. vulgaris]